MLTGKDIIKLAALGAGTYVMKSAFSRLFEYDLKDKTVLITGGSRGLGLVMAREFAREGASVAICARDMEELGRARMDLVRRGARVMAVPCDITDREQVNEMVRAVNARFGRVEVLVNNAGVIEVGPMEVMTLEDYEQAMKTHFWGPLYATLAVLPEMRRRREGRIVNVSSIGGEMGGAEPPPLPRSHVAV